MNRTDIENYANARLDDHGLSNWRFGFDTRSKQRAGVCRHRQRRIELATWTLDLEWPEAEIKDTILHEVAHALAGSGAGHGRRWKREAERVGARPSRCYSRDLPTQRDSALWHEYCPRDCGWERNVHRLVGYGSCPTCGNGSFNPDLLVAIESRDGRPVTAKTVLEGYSKHDALDLLPAGTEGI